MCAKRKLRSSILFEPSGPSYTPYGCGESTSTAYSSHFDSSIHLYGDSNATMPIHCFVAHHSLWMIFHQRSMLLKMRTSALTGSVPNPNQKSKEALELLCTSKTTSCISEKQSPKAILQSSIYHISLVYLFMNY